MVTTDEENEKMLKVIEKDWTHSGAMIWDEGSTHSLIDSHRLIGGYITILVGIDLLSVKNGDN